VSFDLEPGQTLLVVGGSGSGKSTLARLIAGLVPREIPGELRGSLTVDDLDVAVADRIAISARVGIVFQDPGSQLVMDRVEDDVAFGLENRAWPRPSMLIRVPEVLAQVGLAGMGRRRSTLLSGGQQQRLALAGVLAPRPGVLVLDEPTANLDPAGTLAVFERLAELREERAATIVLIEHRVDAAWPFADRVLALARDGSPIDEGPRDEVSARSGTRLRDEGIWLPAVVEAALPPRSEPAGTQGWLRSRDFPERDGSSLPVSPADAAEGRWPVLQTAALTFGYERDTPVVRDVSLVVEAGERIALVGPNGSGKSTLGRLVVGLLQPRHGAVRLLGRDPARLSNRQLAAHAGYIFQDPDLGFIGTRVIDEVVAGLPPQRSQDAGEILERLGLPPAAFADRSPYQLSGGEARRLSLAVALVRNPALLVLDEPTFGQDRRGYEALLEILRERIGRGVAVIAATHDERFVADFAERRIEMAEGWVVADELLRPVDAPTPVSRRRVRAPRVAAPARQLP
jgi:energy-coupling factor transport system ATP-binding protein